LEVREEVRRLADPLAAEDGLELVDVELTVQGGHRTIRVLLDRPGGIRVADCARFSRRLSDCLDMNQTVPGRYFLEVSSPGVQRPIKTLETVERFAGQRAALTTTVAVDGRRHYEGELLGPRDGRAGIRTDEGTEHWFPWAEVKNAHLVVDPWARVRRGGGPR
jgi:ribosome maturation factor RimP